MDDIKTPSQPPVRVSAVPASRPPHRSSGRGATTRGGRSVQLAPLQPLTQPLTSVRTPQSPSVACGRSWAQVAAGHAAAPRSERKARIPGSPPGQAKAVQPQAGAATPTSPPAFPVVIQACMAEPDAASARTLARALAMSLGEAGVEAGREAFLEAWLGAMATGLESAGDTLRGAFEGFAGLTPKNPQRACAWIGVAVPRIFEHFAQAPAAEGREATHGRIQAALQALMLACGAADMAPAALAALLAAARNGCFDAVADAFVTLCDDPWEATERLLHAARSLPPALAGSLMAYLVGMLGPTRQVDEGLAEAVQRCAPVCGARQVTVLAAAHAMASGAQTMDTPAWEAFLALYPFETQAAAHLGARMAVEPLLVFEQARLKPDEQLALLESIYAIPGLLNRRAVSAALLNSLGIQVAPAQRLKLLELLFERGGAWLGLHQVRMARKMLDALARIEGEPLGLATAQALARWYGQGARVDPPATDVVREELEQVRGMRLSDNERATLVAALQAILSQRPAPVSKQEAVPSPRRAPAPGGTASLTTLALADALPLAGPRPLDED